jgi:hypothetical protein
VLIRVSTILICLRASDKSKDVQVEIWSIGQAITPMQNMECREDYNVCTELESYAMESSEKTDLSGTPSEEKYRRHTQSRALRHTLIRIGCEGTPLEML